MKKLLLATAASLSFVATTPANAADFIFTFSTDTGDSGVTNGIAGSVTGRILGLTDNATSSATQVFVDSFSAGAFTGTPTDVTVWTNQFENSFTLANGVITSGSFWADRGVIGTNFDQLFINVALGYANGNTNYASVGVNNDTSIWNNQGLNGVSFQSLGAVPEPATWAFMIFGFGAIGGAMRRQRKVNLKVSYA
ncbi:PEPxxWA-CTERM sorting domain-containing protein [uncultured Parasphingorhabdus sp.]|uniref:PEPxxWA-CTERM sorting domain-containing protein n=1 Tax=uncultured Parasphingorhabdus sp. TaxID=2709694 RepID=UPI0030DC3EF1|tara:strand:- start:1791 stop:2375 length:585 start_codon:yes stop_codon:yes gene_type:complete